MKRTGTIRTDFDTTIIYSNPALAIDNQLMVSSHNAWTSSDEELIFIALLIDKDEIKPKNVVEYGYILHKRKRKLEGEY